MLFIFSTYSPKLKNFGNGTLCKNRFQIGNLFVLSSLFLNTLFVSESFNKMFMSECRVLISIEWHYASGYIKRVTIVEQSFVQNRSHVICTVLSQNIGLINGLTFSSRSIRYSVYKHFSKARSNELFYERRKENNCFIFVLTDVYVTDWVVCWTFMLIAFFGFLLWFAEYKR